MYELSPLTTGILLALMTVISDDVGGRDVDQFGQFTYCLLKVHSRRVGTSIYTLRSTYAPLAIQANSYEQKYEYLTFRDQSS